MKAVEEGDFEQARQLMFGEQYENYVANNPVPGKNERQGCQ